MDPPATFSDVLPQLRFDVVVDRRSVSPNHVRVLERHAAFDRAEGGRVDVLRDALGVDGPELPGLDPALDRANEFRDDQVVRALQLFVVSLVVGCLRSKFEQRPPKL